MAITLKQCILYQIQHIFTVRFQSHNTVHFAGVYFFWGMLVMSVGAAVCTGAVWPWNCDCTQHCHSQQRHLIQNVVGAFEDRCCTSSGRSIPLAKPLPGEFSQTLQVDLSPQQSLWGWTTCCQKNTSWWTVSFPWRSLQGTCTGHTTIKGRKLDQKLYREETKFIQENNSMTGMIGRPSFLEGDHKELHRMNFPYF